MIFIVSFLIALFDQISKFLVLRNIEPGQSIPVLKNILHITLVQNSGAAFGIFPNAAFSLLVISIIAIVVIGYRLWVAKHPAPSIALALILGGAVGNLVDRLRFGYVIDFLDFRIWPVFNLADTAISLGVILLAWQMTRKRKTLNPKL